MDKQFLMDVIVQKEIESIENESESCCTLYLMNAICYELKNLREGDIPPEDFSIRKDGVPSKPSPA